MYLGSVLDDDDGRDTVWSVDVMLMGALLVQLDVMHSVPETTSSW